MKTTIAAVVIGVALLASAPSWAQTAAAGESHTLRLNLAQIMPPDSTFKKEIRLSLWDSPVWRLEYYARRQGAFGDQLIPGKNTLPWSVLAGLGYNGVIRPGVMINGPAGREFHRLTSAELFAQDLGGLLILTAMSRLADYLNHH